MTAFLILYMGEFIYNELSNNGRFIVNFLNKYYFTVSVMKYFIGNELSVSFLKLDWLTY